VFLGHTLRYDKVTLIAKQALFIKLVKFSNKHMEPSENGKTYKRQDREQTRRIEMDEDMCTCVCVFSFVIWYMKNLNHHECLFAVTFALQIDKWI
jgi:hypothetical protein